MQVIRSLIEKVCVPGRGMARLAATGAVLSACCLGTSPAAQAASTVTLHYKCSFPLIGSEPMTASLVWDAAATHRVGQSTQSIPVTVSAKIGPDATVALNFLGATSVQGTADVSGGVVAPQGAINGTIAMTVDKTAVPDSGSLTVVATGALPPAVFTRPGSATLEVGKTFALSITPQTASGGQTLEGVVNTTCTLDQGQSGVIAAFEILPAVTASAHPPTPVATSSSNSGKASGSGTMKVVSTTSAQASASPDPVGSAKASTPSHPTVSAPSASASVANRDLHLTAAQNQHNGLGIAQPLVAAGGVLAVGALAAGIWWLRRRRKKNDRGVAGVPGLPTISAACPSNEGKDADERSGETAVVLPDRAAAVESAATYAGAHRVQVDDGIRGLAAADPVRGPVEAGGEQAQVVSVGARGTQADGDSVGIDNGRAFTPHKPVPGLVRQRHCEQRRRTTSLSRHCRERDRHRGGVVMF